MQDVLTSMFMQTVTSSCNVGSKSQVFLVYAHMSSPECGDFMRLIFILAKVFVSFIGFHQWALYFSNNGTLSNATRG